MYGWREGAATVMARQGGAMKRVAALLAGGGVGRRFWRTVVTRMKHIQLLDLPQIAREWVV